MRLVAVLLMMLAVATLAGCKDMPGADGRYATHGGNRGGAYTGLPVTPYVPH